MNSFEVFLLDCGFSWTASKLVPYLFFPFLGFFLWLALRKRVKRGWLKYTLLVLLIALPFLGYFLVNPIFEGDFSNNSKSVALVPELKVNKQTLVVITIPGCPFCMQSVERMKDFKKRNPKINVEYRVCSTDAASVLPYQQAAGKAFPILLAEEPEKMADVAEGAFPAFVLTDGKSAVKWSNDKFGVGALDEVESKF